MSDRDEMADRLSSRFKADVDSEVAGRSERSEPVGRSEDSSNSEASGNDELNVKEEWNGRYMYIPPEIDKRFDNEFDRLVYECGAELNWKPKKNKHYYPVVAVYGVEAVESMQPESFVEAVHELELPRKE